MTTALLLLLGCPRSTTPAAPEPPAPAPVEAPAPVAAPAPSEPPAPPPMTPEAGAEPIEITDGQQMMTSWGKRVVVTGVVERHPYPTGGDGTALVVAIGTGTKLWLSEGEPPEGYAAVVGQRVQVEATLTQGPTPGGQRIRIPFLADPTAPVDAPL